MNCLILVVEHEGERFFEFGGLKFDTLEASFEFDECEVQVFEGRQKIGRAWMGEARGEAAFKPYADDPTGRLSRSALHAEKFELGETLVIGVPDGFDLTAYLRQGAHGLREVSVLRFRDRK